MINQLEELLQIDFLFLLASYFNNPAIPHIKNLVAAFCIAVLLIDSQCQYLQIYILCWTAADLFIVIKGYCTSFYIY